MTEVKLNWNFIDNDQNLPPKKGYYLIAFNKWGFSRTVQAFFDPEERFIDTEDPVENYSEGFFEDAWMNYEFTGVYAWAEMPEPPSMKVR